MGYEITERVDDQDAFNLRTGFKVKRLPLDHLVKLQDLIHQCSPYPLSYDVGRIQDSSFDEVNYTELFKNAMYVCPHHTETSFKMALIALGEYPLKETDDEYWDKIEEDKNILLNKMQLRDKYELSKPSISPKSIMFLPGSNSLKKAVALDEITKWLYLDDNLYLKPHPLTNEVDLHDLKMVSGIQRLIPNNVSGWELLSGANRVYVPSTSELGLYAKLLGKKVIDITLFDTSDEWAYSPLYRYINYPYDSSYDYLVRVLINPMSGVMFHDTELDVVQAYFKRLQMLQEVHKLTSPYDFKRRAKIKVKPTPDVEEKQRKADHEAEKRKDEMMARKREEEAKIEEAKEVERKRFEEHKKAEESRLSEKT